jgi:hypothetical protein
LSCEFGIVNFISNTYRLHRETGLFNEQIAVFYLYEINNPMESISYVVDIEIFHAILELRLPKT